MIFSPNGYLAYRYIINLIRIISNGLLPIGFRLACLAFVQLFLKMQLSRNIYLMLFVRYDIRIFRQNQ